MPRKLISLRINACRMVSCSHAIGVEVIEQCTIIQTILWYSSVRGGLLFATLTYVNIAKSIFYDSDSFPIPRMFTMVYNMQADGHARDVSIDSFCSRSVENHDRISSFCVRFLLLCQVVLVYTSLQRKQNNGDRIIICVAALQMQTLCLYASALCS